jgi:hypothetical protein
LGVHVKKTKNGTIASLVLLAVLAACGGGSGSSGSDGGDGSTPPPAEKPASRAEAARFLTQATFGPTDADIDRVLAIGYDAWIDEQFAKPASTNRPLWEAADAAVKALNANNSVYQDGTINAFWRNAVSADDQLRQRVAYSLSQIFVISMQDGTVGDDPRAVAAYQLEGVALDDDDLLEPPDPVSSVEVSDEDLEEVDDDEDERRPQQEQTRAGRPRSSRTPAPAAVARPAAKPVAAPNTQWRADENSENATRKHALPVNRAARYRANRLRS